MPRDRPPAADDDAVRRLLAGTRHVDPVPADVAQRLDRALAELATQTDPGAAPTEAVVVPLRSDKSRRRRRVALLAAAASVVAAVGIGQALRTGVAGTDEASSSVATADTADEDRSGPVERGEGASEDRSESAAQAPGGANGLRRTPAPATGDTARRTLLLLGDDPARVRADRFARDVRRVRALAATPEQRGGLGDQSAQQAVPDAYRSCLLQALGAGRAVAVDYDGAPAVLLLRPTAGDSQVVDLLQCGTGRTLRSLTLSR